MLGFWGHGQADPNGYQWQPSGPFDLRSPCPILNSLANHGYLPHGGRNIDAPTLNAALSAGLDFDPSAFSDVVENALSTSTTGNSSTFNLDDTAVHNVIEHDGSLSRDDIAHGDNLHFSPEVWAQTVSHFTEDTISIEVAAKARADRIVIASSTNMNFYFLNNSLAGLAEISFYQILLGIE
ncbi:Chloroperoxidase [Truncatella angustata]|uniref:Chloroperoxidase n=1 Tax=Truncatella angustata TaxID=152316 RepID=A0A9P8ZZ80_9PEZI|nr:Chloroperoxidase [Truncatella angustata]KAH6655793.1 Chloroperoxidase [Truncatella angustata]